MIVCSLQVQPGEDLVGAALAKLAAVAGTDDMP